MVLHTNYAFHVNLIEILGVLHKNNLNKQTNLSVFCLKVFIVLLKKIFDKKINCIYVDQVYKK